MPFSTLAIPMVASASPLLKTPSTQLALLAFLGALHPKIRESETSHAHNLRRQSSRDESSNKLILVNDLTDFLNNPPLHQEKRSRDMMSLWSSVRKSLTQMSCAVKFEGTEVPLVSGRKIVDARNRLAIRNTLRHARDQKRLSTLLDAKDQGRSFHLISESWFSSHWLQNGI